MWNPPIALTLEEQKMETIASLPSFGMVPEGHLS
jgi:hypothetical protein